MCVCNEGCTCNEEDMINEIRYYLQFVLDTMHPETISEHTPIETFVPQYIVTAVQLPTGAIEVSINDKCIEEKIRYILEAYDDNMKLKTNPNVEMKNIMIV